MDMDINVNADDLNGLKAMIFELCKSVSKIADKLDKIEDIQIQILNRMDKIEGDINRHEKDISKIKAELLKLKLDFDPETTIVAINPPLGPSDDQEQVARHLVQKLGGDVSNIKQVTTAGGKHGKKPILKVEVTSTEEKVNLLRNKEKLKDSGLFKHTYVRSSKSHIERMIQSNFQTILQQLPEGGNYRFTGNGRLVRKDPPHMNQPAQGARGYSTPANVNRQTYRDALVRQNNSFSTGSPSPSILDSRQ
jgi:hypothetical protein